MKILNRLIAFAFVLGMSSMASAAIPPPPVNQNLGIPDTSFSNFSKELCQACHWASAREIDPLSGAPVKKGYNPNRHHMALYTEIDGIPEFPPERDANDDGENDTHYSCLNCHIVNVGGIDIAYATLLEVIEPNFRDCLICHKREAGPLTVHHTTELAQTGFCFKCHGGLVRGIDVDTLKGKKPDPNDVNGTIPVSIPEYSTSMITPWRSGKPNGDLSNKNHADIAPGNCNYCHNTAEGSTKISGDDGGTIQTVKLPDGSTFEAPILTNAQNHHNTGFYQDQKCAWCHEIDGEFQTGAQSIRVCQRCHDRTTLHNIEFDNDRDGIIAGGEDPYYGHIGNQDNCWGCHGNNKTIQDEDGNWVDPRENLGAEVRNQGIVVSDEDNARIDVVTALVPTIDTLSTQSVSTGEEVKITIVGTNIVNSSKMKLILSDDDGNMILDDEGRAQLKIMIKTWSSEVVVTDKNNNSIIIDPDYQDTNKLEFTLPATLAKGFYQVSLRKAFIESQSLVDGKIVANLDQQVSNPIGITIVPSIAIQQSLVYTPFGGLAIIAGANLMESVNGLTYKLVDQNGQAPLVVYVWRDDLVIALFDEIPESVTIETLFDEKTMTLDKF